MADIRHGIPSQSQAPNPVASNATAAAPSRRLHSLDFYFDQLLQLRLTEVA